MAAKPVIHIVCSDQHRNGKTLLARVLVDYLMLDGRDPFIIDADAPDGNLRNYFPGRTILVDFETIRGQMKLFDTILASPGRDYVIDLPATQTSRFCEAVSELGFFAEARRAGFHIVVYFVVDKVPASRASAAQVENQTKPDLLVPVRNAFVDSSLLDTAPPVVISMPALPPELVAIIANKRFSFRGFLLGGEDGVPQALRTRLKGFLYDLLTGFREIAPVLSLSKLRS